MGIGAAIAGGSILGGVISGDAAQSAADTQAAAANRSADIQNSQFQKTQENLKPYMDTGIDAQTKLRNLLGIGEPTDGSTYGGLNKRFDADAFHANIDPGYQFQLDQGTKALQNNQAAQNGVLSGAALKDLIGFNQGMANTAYQNAFDRWNTQNTNTFNRLSSLLGIGENAAAGAGNIGAQTSANIGNAVMSAGNAQAAGQVGMANALTGGINNGMGYYMMNNLTGGKLLGGGGGAALAAPTAGADLGTGVTAPSSFLAFGA